MSGRALQIHGALGLSDEMPFGAMVIESFHMGLADGATEVHKLALARQVLKGYKATDDLFPTGHLLRVRPWPRRSTTTCWQPRDTRVAPGPAAREPKGGKLDRKP